MRVFASVAVFLELVSAGQPGSQSTRLNSIFIFQETLRRRYHRADFTREQSGAGRIGAVYPFDQSTRQIFIVRLLDQVLYLKRKCPC